MAQQLIQTGISANDGNGDTLRIAGTKINENFTELYDSVYTLPTAGVGSGGTLGGVKVDGTTITVTNGIITANYTPYTLPTASTTVLGGVKIDGSTITLNGSNQLVSTQYSLPTASTTILGGVKIDGSTITLNGSNQLVSTQYSLPTATTSVLGGVKVDGTSILISDGVISSSVSMPSRTTASVTSASLTAGSSGTYTITGFKGYALLKIQTSSAAWVTLYTDTAARTSDSSRSEAVDPLPGSGVVAEVITTGAETIVISPGTIGFSNEGTPTTSIPIKIVNKGVSSTTITVTLTVLKIED